MQTYTTTESGRRYRSAMSAKATRVQGNGGDAGRIGADAGLRPRPAPRPRGVLTPAVAMGDALTDRLIAAGFRISVVEL